MSRKPYNPIISSDAIWPAIAQALGIEEDLRGRVTRVEIVLEPRETVEITVTVGMVGDTQLCALDWPQFDPSQITIVEQG